jgi:hypothetical protein
MPEFRPACPTAAVALLLALGTPTSRAAGQPSPAATRAFKSVYGQLESVDRTQNRLLMLAEGGERREWRFRAAVIAEAARFKPGDRMIVIYRPLAHNEKRVTAVAFPGSASTPIYLNLTGERVVVRSGPAVDGACDKPGDGPVQESTVPSGGMTEVMESCWCCAPAGETCTPGNLSGLGRALLVQCFQ